MLSNLEIFIVAILSIGGALFGAFLGWLESGEPFVARTFASSMLRAFLAGAITAGSTFAGLDTIANGWIYIFVFLAGAGVDVLAKRTAGAIRAGTAKTPT